MKEIKLSKKGSYEEVVKLIYNNFTITEPTRFTFKKIVETNAKMRRYAKYKNVYEYEIESYIELNDENHKKNLYKKVCSHPIGGYTPDWNALGID